MYKILMKLLIVPASFFFLCTPPVVINIMEINDVISTIPAEWLEEPVIIISDSTDMEFVSDKKGNRLIHTSTVLYYINKQKPEVLQTLFFRGDETCEMAPDVNCKVIFSDGTGSNPQLLNTANGYYQELSLPEYKQGMMVRISVRRTYVKPEYFPWEIAGESMPVVDRHIQLTVPENARIVHEFTNNEGLALSETNWAANGKKTTSWTFKKMEKLDNFEMYPRPGEWFAALYLSLPPEGTTSYSWQDLGDYYLSQLNDVYADIDSMTLFTENTRQSGSADSIISDVLLLVRNKIRYHDAGDVRHAVIPHTVKSIAQNGYGDCKDMSVLCQSLAKRMNVDLELVLLKSNYGFEARQSVPTLGAFDHVIIAAALPDGTVIVADPTLTFGKPLETGFYHNGKKALFLVHGASRFDTIPKSPGFYNTVTTRSSIKLDTSEKRWMLSGTITVSGLSAMYLYPDFNGLPLQEQLPLLKRYLKSCFELDADGVSLERLTADTISIRYAAPFQENYLSMSGGGFVLNKPSVYGGDVRFTTISYFGPHYFDEIRQLDTWQLPGSYRNLEKHDLDSPIARGMWEMRNNVVTRDFMQKKIRVGSEEAGKSAVLKNKFLNATVWKK